MPKFGQDSFSKLSTCHHDLQVLFFEVIKHCDCIVLQGYRNELEQKKLFDVGNSKFEWPNSLHNVQPSMAVDVAPFPMLVAGDMRHYFFAGYVMATAQILKDEGKMTHAIRYGAGWHDDIDKNKNHNDLVHFELVD